MEVESEDTFPWIKDVAHSFAKFFMVDYNSEALSVLHRNIDKEIKIVYSSNNHRIVKRSEALYQEITHLYEHMRLKISQHSDFQNATLSCVKLMSQLIKVGLVLTQGYNNSEWSERILTAIQLFPGDRHLVYDALLLVNGLKKIHHKPYSAILRYILTEDHHEYVTDPLVYMEITLLFRRLKALVLNRYKEHYTVLLTKIKPPSNIISWLASLDVNGFSPYLKNLQYKKIALQLMKKNLPESFIKKIRCMALNPYNFEIDSYEFKATKTKERPLYMFIIDDTTDTKCDNLDMLMNSQKAFSKKKVKSHGKKKKLELNKNIFNKKDHQSSNENKSCHVNINNSGTDITGHKHFQNSKEYITLYKKKQKSMSKFNLVKNTKSKTSAKDLSHGAVFFHDVEDSSTSQQLNKNILNEKNPESSRENKIRNAYTNESGTDITSHEHFPNANEHISVSKKKQKSKSKRNLVENIESKTYAITDKDVSHNALYFHDVERRSPYSKQLETVHNVSSCSISPKRRFSDDTDTDTKIQKALKKKNRKSLKSSKNNETTSDSCISSDDKINSNLLSHRPLVSESNEDKQENSFKDDDVILIAEKVFKKKNRKRLKPSKSNETTSDNYISNNDKINSSIVSHRAFLSENVEDERDDEDVILIAEMSKKKRKKCTPTDDSATSEDKCKYFKKLMLKKVDSEAKTSLLKVSNEQESTIPATTVGENSKLSCIKENNNVDGNTVAPNAHYNAVNVGEITISSHLKNIDNMLVQKDKNDLIIHTSGKTELVIKPEVASELSTFGSTTQTIKESNEKITEKLSLKLKNEENFVKNKKADVLLHVKDINVKSVSNIKCKDIENTNLKKDEKTLESEQISNKESRFLPEYPNIEDVPENVTIPSQNSHVKDGKNNTCMKDLSNNKPMLNISDSTDLSTVDDSVSNQNQQFSEQCANKCPATSNAFIGSSSYEGLDNTVELSEDFKNSLIDKNLCSTTLKELSVKTNLKPINSETCLADEIQKSISTLPDYVLSYPASLDLMQSKDKSLLGNNEIRNDSTACSAENSTDVKSESKSELSTITTENTESNEAFDNADSIIVEITISCKDTSLNDASSKDSSTLCSTEQQNKDLQNMLSNVNNTQSEVKKHIDIDTGVANNSEITECAKISHVQLQHQHVSFDNDEKRKCETSKNLNNECKDQDSKTFILLTKDILSADIIASSKTFDLETMQSKNQSTKTVICGSEDINEKTPKLEDVENANPKCEEKGIEFETTLRTLHPGDNKKVGVHIENNSKHSDVSFVNQENNSEKIDAQSFDKLNDKKLSSCMVINETYSISHNPSRDPIKKCLTDKYEKSDQLKDVDFQDDISNKNIERSISSEKEISVNKSASLDSISNSVTDVKISSKEKEDSSQLLQTEKVVDAFEKLDELKAVNSHNSITRDKESTLSSKESTFSENINNSINDLKIFKKEKVDTLQSPLESEKNACENSDQFKVVNSQDDITLKENDKRSKSNKLFCFDSNSENDVKISVKVEEDTLQVSLESKNVIKAPLSNCENTSFIKKAIQMNNPSLHSTEPNCHEFEKSPENDLTWNSEFQEQFFVLDESNSDVDDAKSNYSEQLIENSSPVKKLQHSNSKVSLLKISATAANESKFKALISPNDANCKNLYENQIEPIVTEDTSKVLLENSANEIDSKNHENARIGNSSSARTKKSESILSSVEKDLLLNANDFSKSSLKDSRLKGELISDIPIVENDCSSVLITNSSQQLELKYTEVNEPNTKRNLSTSIFVPSFCGNNNYESFSEISFKNKDKIIDVGSVGPVPINNFVSAASTELFSMYRNDLMHDEDKTDTLSSRDCILANSQEIDEIKSQCFSSDHSDEEMGSKYSSQEDEDEGNTMNSVIPSEDCNVLSNNINESVSSNCVPVLPNLRNSSAKMEDDLPDGINCSEDTNMSDSSVSGSLDGTCEKKSVKNVLPRQSLGLKNKTESKCQTNPEGNAASDISTAQEASKKELKLVLTDCNSKSENGSSYLCSSVKDASSYSLTSDNNKDSASSQTSIIKKNLSTAEEKEKDSSVDCSDKRYSLRCRKKKQSKDDSANLGIDLNKLKFDSPNSKCTRSRRESKFVKLLVSDIKLQNNPCNVLPTKTEASSSTAKSEVGTGSNTPSYNLRNRKSIIAPPKLKI